VLVRPDLSCARHRFDLYKLFLVFYLIMRIIRTSRTSKIGGRGERQRGAVASGRRTCRRRCPRASRRRAPSSPCLRCVTRCTPHPPIRPVSSPGPDPEWFTLVRDVSRLDRGLDCAVSLVSVTRLSVSRPLPVESQTLSIRLSWALSLTLSVGRNRRLCGHSTRLRTRRRASPSRFTLTSRVSIT